MRLQGPTAPPHAHAWDAIQVDLGNTQVAAVAVAELLAALQAHLRAGQPARGMPPYVSLRALHARIEARLRRPFMPDMAGFPSLSAALDSQCAGFGSVHHLSLQPGQGFPALVPEASTTVEQLDRYLKELQREVARLAAVLAAHQQPQPQQPQLQYQQPQPHTQPQPQPQLQPHPQAHQPQPQYQQPQQQQQKQQPQVHCQPVGGQVASREPHAAGPASRTEAAAAGRDPRSQQAAAPAAPHPGPQPALNGNGPHAVVVADGGAAGVQVHADPAVSPFGEGQLGLASMAGPSQADWAAGSSARLQLGLAASCSFSSAASGGSGVAAAGAADADEEGRPDPSLPEPASPMEAHRKLKALLVYLLAERGRLGQKLYLGEVVPQFQMRTKLRLDAVATFGVASLAEYMRKAFKAEVALVPCTLSGRTQVMHVQGLEEIRGRRREWAGIHGRARAAPGDAHHMAAGEAVEDPQPKRPRREGPPGLPAAASSAGVEQQSGGGAAGGAAGGQSEDLAAGRAGSYLAPLGSGGLARDAGSFTSQGSSSYGVGAAGAAPGADQQQLQQQQQQQPLEQAASLRALSALAAVLPHGTPAAVQQPQQPAVAPQWQGAPTGPSPWPMVRDHHGGPDGAMPGAHAAPPQRYGPPPPPPAPWATQPAYAQRPVAAQYAPPLQQQHQQQPLPQEVYQQYPVGQLPAAYGQLLGSYGGQPGAIILVVSGGGDPAALPQQLQAMQGFAGQPLQVIPTGGGTAAALAPFRLGLQPFYPAGSALPAAAQVLPPGSVALPSGQWLLPSQPMQLSDPQPQALAPGVAAGAVAAPAWAHYQQQPPLPPEPGPRALGGRGGVPGCMAGGAEEAQSPDYTGEAGYWG